MSTPNEVMLNVLKDIKDKLENPDAFDSLTLFEILASVSDAIDIAEGRRSSH